MEWQDSLRHKISKSKLKRLARAKPKAGNQTLSNAYEPDSLH